ncbi:MAG TPA: PKD domain-containing protein [Bacteroidia bacterium]|jgi:gliding motility-associated-like protein|nr:PKD domain-containing protein [Bacteroidia bacterium]
MRSYLKITIVLALSSVGLFGQSNPEPGTLWSAKPFDHSVFIKNAGQFADEEVKGDILFTVDLGKTKIYFTSNSVIYRYDEFTKIKKEDGKEENKGKEELEREQKLRNAKPEKRFFSQEWQGANSVVSISTEGEEPYYFTYTGQTGHEIKTTAYKKIIYKNLYPNIDAEYFFVENKAGLKYNLIVHPGADLSLVKLDYVGGGKNYLQANGDIICKSKMGPFTDHAPETFYEDGTKLKSNYTLNRNEVSFEVEKYDANKTIIIDPWTTNPNIPGGWAANLAYDVDYDNYGNVYALGSYFPFVLVKLNSAGVILWKYTVPAGFSQSYGDFAVDHTTGTSYIVAGTSTGGFNTGSQVLKVSTAGSLLASHPGIANGMYEMWRCAFDPCNKQIVIAGGGVYNTTQSLAMDTNLNIIVNPQNVLGATLQGGTSFHDMCMIALDPMGNWCYMGATKSNVNPGWDDLLCKVPVTSLAPTAYKTPLGFPYTLREGYLNGMVLGTVSIGNPNSFSNALNGMAASPNWLYVCDGTTLTKYNKNSGASVANSTVYNWSNPFSKDSVRWSGTDADMCDNVYIGVKNQALIYNSNLTLTQTINLTDTVFDVRVGKNNLLYACGKGFVSASTITGSSTVLTHSSTPVASCSACNGTATANLTICGNPATGATYSWSTIPVQTTQTAINLCPGTYTVTVTMGCGLKYTDTVNLVSPPGTLTATTQSVTNVICNAASTGAATVTASGGVSPYVFSWSNGQTNSTATNLSAGNYTCTVTDANGCKDTALVTITQPTPIVLTTTSTPVHCNLNDGTASVTASGGTSPYTYNWNSGQTTSSISNSAGGNYTVTITDANNCVQTNTVAIASATGLTYTLTPGTIKCFGDTTSVTIVVTSSLTYTVSWNLNPVATGLAMHGAVAGNYTGSITDAAGCTTNFSVALTQPAQIVPGFTVNTACFGNPLQFTDQSTGGPFTNWSWSFGDGGNSVLQNPQHNYASTGTYTVTLNVTNPAGCSASVNQTVQINPLLNVVFTADTVCLGNATTFTDLTQNVPAGSVYNWNFGDGSSSSQIANTTHTYSSTATYIATLTITSPQGCVDKSILSILIKPLPLVNHINPPEFCPNQITPAINFTATPGGTTATFFWVNINTTIGLGSNGTGNLPSFTTINNVNTAVNSTILVHAWFKGCTGPDSIFTITINPDPAANFYAQNKICQGNATQFTDNSTGNIAQWNWDMDNDGIFSDATTQNPRYTFATPGTHTVNLSVSSNKNCKDTVSKTIYINPLPRPAFIGDNLTGCPILNVNFTDLSAITTPAQITSWSWDFGNGNTFNGQFPPTISYNNTSHTQNETYTVSLTVTSDSGCAANITKANYITVYPHPVADFNYVSNANETDGIDPTVHFYDQSTGANYMHWFLGDVFANLFSTNYTSVTNPVHTYLYDQPYMYYVTEWVSNSYGCKDSITKPIEVKPGFTFYIPNAFSPNSDGVNEGFKGTGIGIDNSTYRLFIFDRWGNQIFESHDLEKVWDGTVRGKGDVVQEDVYVWKADFKDYSGMKHEYKGTVSLIK